MRPLDMKVGLVAAVVAMFAASGLGAAWPPSEQQQVSSPPSSLTDAKVGVPYEHGLLTHCGIRETRFAGEYWLTPLLDDGNRNPPRGWVNGVAAGTMTLADDDTALFEDDGGHVVEFELREGATDFLQICA